MTLHQGGYERAVIVPTLTVTNCTGAIAFYRKAFDAMCSCPTRLLTDL